MSDGASGQMSSVQIGNGDGGGLNSSLGCGVSGPWRPGCVHCGWGCRAALVTNAAG